MKEAINLTVSEEEKIDTVIIIEKSQASHKTVYIPKINKTDKVKLIDKSRSTQRTDTKNNLYKLRFIPGTNVSNTSTRIEKPASIYLTRIKEKKSRRFNH